jgi:uncharacterized membrane protein
MFTILQYGVVALAIYVVLDLIWMSLVSKGVYRNEVGELIRTRPNYFAAALLYIVIAFGLVYFVTEPAISGANIVYAILAGLGFGFVVSAVYALTNLAILKNWSVTLALIDITWISFLSAATSLLTYLIFV